MVLSNKTSDDNPNPALMWSEFISGKSLDGEQLTDTQRINSFCRIIQTGHPLYTLVPICPLLLNLDGHPYSLVNHFPFENLLSTVMPRKLVMRTSRQVSKSTSIAAHGVLLAAMRRFHTLYVTPLYEQVRRFSNNYVRPFIMDSPIKPLLIDTSTENSVLQRSFRNGSIMHFSYAGLTADRCRGIKADRCAFDEVQDLDPDHIDIITECMSHSPYGITQFTGTPKTKDNTIETLWDSSSQAEWVIRCTSCNTDNVPSLDYHLEKMIGPWREDISEEKPGVICHKCGRPMSPRNGRWMHRYPDRKQLFEGYHVPQIIMPVHYANPEKWSVLLSKQKTTNAATFINEVLGEGCDVATKLVTKTDLENAGVLHVNDIDVAVNRVNTYVRRILAVDWGGGGEKGVSYTKMAVLGYTPTGKIECIYGKMSLNPHNHVEEALLCKEVFQKFHCHMLAHDYTGAGNLRETVLVQSGMATSRLMPIELVRTAAHALFQYVPASDQHPRARWRLDKARSLQLTCYSIKFGLLKFFKYDYVSPENPGLLHDFLALNENKVSTAHGGDIYTIFRNPLLSDDFAQAVNLGCSVLWHMYQSWPNFASMPQHASALTPKQAQALGPVDTDPWMMEESAMGGYFNR